MAIYCELNLWEKIRGFDTSNISSSFMNKHPQFKDIGIDEIELNFKRFFYILRCNLEFPHYILSQPVIEYWKDCVLDTRMYAKLCEYGTGFFLHYDPYYKSKSEEFLVKSNNQICKEIESNFGELNRKIWSISSESTIRDDGKILYDVIKNWIQGKN